MRLRVLDEPKLEFRAGNRHVDPRVGVATFGPADADAPAAPKTIPVGLVGSAAAIEGVRRWLGRCREPIDARKTKPGQENLHLAFPAFNGDEAFLSELVFDDSLVREIPDRDLRQLAKSDVSAAVKYGADLYMAAAKSLSDTGRCRVILCARPDELKDESGESLPDHEEQDDEEEQEEGERLDFHDLLKATALTLPCPLQLIKRETWTGKRHHSSGLTRPLQDEATRAWNLHAALYYKAGGTPWRLPRASTDLATCFIGVSFFRTLDDSELHTAVAQVFNERGDGVVVRGGTAQISKIDRRVHLSEEAAEALLVDALAEFRRNHGHQPARVVIHKSSAFDEAERTGFQRAAEKKEIDHVELIWVQRRGGPRLFRKGQLPPLRGTALELGEDALVLYSRGSVEFFRTYPGLYVPRPLLLHASDKGIDLITAATEILGLSKMNWNNAQLDERDPLTLRTADRVGAILKYVDPGVHVATRYGFYM